MFNKHSVLQLIQMHDRSKKIMPFAWVPLMHEALSLPCLVHQWWQQHHTNNNHPQPEKVITAPSTSKWQYQCLRQSHKCHALYMNASNHLYQWQQQQQHQIINDHVQWQQKHQTTIILNYKKFNTAPSASEWQHQCSRQSCKCHALCMNTLNQLFQ